MLYERICDLKSRGYRMIVRIVCTPDKLDLLDDLEARFRACDVTLTPLPEIEFRSADAEIGLPRAYTPEQRSFLENRFKGYGELAMLYGGIDVASRSCFAGSRMLFMNSHSFQNVAQISPCNLTSHLVMADVAEFIGPSPARSIESLLLRGFRRPVSRRNRRCDCPGLVENDIIAGIPTRARYKAMATGYVPALGATAAAWIRENGVKFGQDATARKESSSTADNRACPNSPRLIETIGSYNIVHYDQTYFCVPQAAGPLRGVIRQTWIGSREW